MTTILAVRHNKQVSIGGDGQVSHGSTMVKGEAVKIRRLDGGKVLAGFAGSTADAMTLLEKYEVMLKKYQGNVAKAAVELAKEWRTDKILRRLESLLLFLDVIIKKVHPIPVDCVRPATKSGQIHIRQLNQHGALE